MINYLYTKYFNFFNFTKKLNRLTREKKLYKKILYQKTKRKNRLKKLAFQNVPKSRLYWKQPGLRKKMKFYKNVLWNLHYRRHPWLTILAKKESIYKWNFYRSFFRKKNTYHLKKNKVYLRYFFGMSNPHLGDLLKTNVGKKKIQKRFFVRYYIYLPYFNHISSKKFIKHNKKLRRTKKTLIENKWLKRLSLNLEKFLPRINLASNKQNSCFLLSIKAAVLHNKQNIFYANFLKNKKKNLPVYHKTQQSSFDWKKQYLFTKLPEVSKKQIVNKNESISVNRDYNKLNWSFFISRTRKKYIPHYCNINYSKNIICLNKFFLYRFILKNERLCKKWWTPISLLKNKIRYYYV